MKDIKVVKIWKIMHQGIEKRVTTIEQDGRHPCNCEWPSPLSLVAPLERNYANP